MNVHSRSTSRESEPNYRCFAAHDLLPIKASREWERFTPWTLISRTILPTIHRHNVALNSPQAGRFYPAYFWYPPTYGFAAWYNPYAGTFGRGAAVYGPYGGAGGWAAYNSRTGTYARGGALYGPYGSRGFAQAWNPRTGTYAQTRQGSNVCGNWGPSYVQRGDNWAQARCFDPVASEVEQTPEVSWWRFPTKVAGKSVKNR